MPRATHKSSDSIASAANKAYNVRTILMDKTVGALAAQFRGMSPRPCLRKRSSLMKKLPWMCPALCEADSLRQWVVDQRKDGIAREPDALENFAAYLDHWETEGIYADSSNKDLKLLIRRMGLEEEDADPPPHRFAAIAASTRLSFTESHSWLILYRLFDVMVACRELDCSAARQFPPAPAAYMRMMQSNTATWLGMRVDWQKSLKQAISVVEGNLASREINIAPEYPSLASAAGDDGNTTGLQVVSAQPGVGDGGEVVSDELATAFTTDWRAGGKGMELLFRKMDQLSLTEALNRLLPSVTKSDGKAKYLAITLNIELAAMTAGYLVLNGKPEGGAIVFADIYKDVPEANRADWFTPRLTYHPIAVAAFLSPLYLLYWGRHYSSPMQFHEIFLAWMASGNMGRPRALTILERDIWSLVFQVALGASVHQILPIHISRWANSINDEEVSACKSWLDDFGLGEAAAGEGRLEEISPDDEITLLHHVTAQRDEHRAWKLEPTDAKVPLDHVDAPKSPVAGQKRKERSTEPAPASKRRASEKARAQDLDALDRMSPLTPEPEPALGPGGDENEVAHASGSKNVAHNNGPVDRQDEASVGEGRGSLGLGPVDDGPAADSADERPPSGGGDGDRPLGAGNGNDSDNEVVELTRPVVPRPKPKGRKPQRRRTKNHVQPPVSSAAVGHDDEEDMLVDDDDLPGPAPGLAASRAGTPEDTVPFETHGVDIPAWGLSIDEPEVVTWFPQREKTMKLFEALSTAIARDYSPGSAHSSVVVWTDSEAWSTSSVDAMNVLRHKHILVRSTQVNDPNWAWGNAAFSVLRPVHGTTVQVQDVNTLAYKKNFEASTIMLPLADLIRAGKPGSGKVYNCLELPLGEKSLVSLPFVSDNSVFNVMPSLFNVACGDEPSFDVDAARLVMHWALAGTSGAETVQHVDAGGCGTVIRVLSGRKVWIVGTPANGTDFTNSSFAFAHRDNDGSWDCALPEGMTWEAMLLGPGDTLYQRPGTAHAMITLESSLVYGMYMYTPSTLVPTITSFAATLLGDRIAANARVDGSLEMLLSLASWWWNGDLALGDDADVFDAAARCSRPSLADDPSAYVAVLALCVFQTALAGITYDTFDAKRAGEMIRVPDGRLYWEEAERLHEFVARQGVLSRVREDVVVDPAEVDRDDELREVILDYGRAMLAMAGDLHRTNRFLNVSKLRNALNRDVKAAYGLSAGEWVDRDALGSMPFIPPVTFVSDPAPDHAFQFASS